MNLQQNFLVKNREANVLVLVPTRELAVQVATVFKTFSKNLLHPVKTLAVYGGVSINPQMMALKGVNLVVGIHLICPDQISSGKGGIKLQNGR